MDWIRKQYPTDVGPHACNLCPEQFAVSSALLVHKLTNHTSSKISYLLNDLLDNEVLNSSDDDYCYTFVFTTTYHRYPNTTIKIEPFLEDVACGVLSFDACEDQKPFVDDINLNIQDSVNPLEATAEPMPSNQTTKRSLPKLRKMCPICGGRFHPQGLYRHIRMMHNRRYSIARGREKLTKSVAKPVEEFIEIPAAQSPPPPSPESHIDALAEQELQRSDSPLETPAEPLPSRSKVRLYPTTKNLRKICPICGGRFHPQGLYRHIRMMHNRRYSIARGREKLSKSVAEPVAETQIVEEFFEIPAAQSPPPPSPESHIDTLAEQELQRSDSPLEPPAEPLSSHSKVRLYPTTKNLRKICPICGGRFHPQGLYRHIRKIHNRCYSTARGREKLTKTVAKPGAVDKKFVEIEAAVEDTAQSPPPPPVQLSETIADTLGKHSDRSRTSFKARKRCPICGRRFHPQGLYRHMRMMHNTKYSIAKGRPKFTTTLEQTRAVNTVAEDTHVEDAHLGDTDIEDVHVGDTDVEDVHVGDTDVEDVHIMDTSAEDPLNEEKASNVYDDEESTKPCVDEVFVDIDDGAAQTKSSTKTGKVGSRIKVRKSCPICGRRFHPKGLYRHVRMMHNTTYAAIRGRAQQISEPDAETQFVACDVMDIEAAEAVEDVDAETLAEQSDQSSSKSKLRKMCPVCGGCFHPLGLYRHIMSVHNIRYSVTKGPNQFMPTTIETDIGKPVMHPVIKKRRKCPICSRVYHRQGLSRHLQNMHNQSKADIAAMHKRYRAQRRISLTDSD